MLQGRYILFSRKILFYIRILLTAWQIQNTTPVLMVRISDSKHFQIHEEENFEDPKGVIRSRKSYRQHNGHKILKG